MKASVIGLNRFTSPSGVCISIRNFIQCLQEIDIVKNVELIIGSWQADYYIYTLAVLDNSKVKITLIDIPNTSFSRNKWFFVGLNKTVRSSDLVLLGYPIPLMGLNKPIITILHDLYPFDYPLNFGFPNVLINQLLFLVNLFATNSYLCVSMATQSSLSKRFKALVKNKRIANIYNYVPFREVSVSPQIHQRGYWLCVAQHRKNKNIDIIIETFYLHQLEHDVSELDLVIVGSQGPETLKLQKLIEDYNLGGKVCFLQNISDDMLVNLYQHASLIVNASSIEGFGLPLIEACYYGKKCVATKIPVYEELVKLVPLFSLEKTPVENLLAVIKKTLEVNYVKPILNPNLSKQVITSRLSDLITTTVDSFYVNKNSPLRP